MKIFPDIFLCCHWKNHPVEYIILFAKKEQSFFMEYLKALLDRKKSFHFCFGVICIIYVIMFTHLPTRSIWISDEGNRLMSVQAYAATGEKFLPDPFAQIGEIPKGVRAYPKPYFVQEKDGSGSWRSAYALLFPYLASYVYLLGGWDLLYWIPMIFGLLTSLLCGVLAEMLFKSRIKGILCMVLCAFGTPLLFYSGTFLESTMAACFAMGGLWLFLYCVQKEERSLRQEWVLTLASGLLLGVSCLFREESFIFAFAMGTGMMLYYFRWNRLWGMALGGAIPVLSLFIYNYLDSGSVFGMHSKVYDSLGRPEGNVLLLCLKDYSFYLFLLCLPVYKIWNVIFPWIFPATIGVSFFSKVRNWVISAALILTLASCVCSSYWNMTTAHGGVFIYQSLLDHLPLFGAVLACGGLLLRYGKERFIRFLTYVSMVCVFLPVLGLNFDQPGMFWGGRHFLNIIPVLCILSMALLSGDLVNRIIKILTVALMVLSVAVSLCGYSVLKMKKEYSDSYVRALSQKDVKVIVTDVFFFPEEIAFLNREKSVILLTEKDSLEQILPLFEKHGIKSFHLVLGKESRRLSNESIRRASQKLHIEALEYFPSKRFGFFAVQIFRCSFR